MSNALTTVPEQELITTLSNSLYPGASYDSIGLVLSYCRAAGLDPMLKPVHIVPMWSREAGGMRDVVMPGIGLYRVQASRTGECAGVSEPEFGPDVTETLGGMSVTYPAWARVTVKRQLANGVIAEYTAKEFWKENYAVKGGKEKSIAPNAMWAKRPYGQIAKCAEAQALRKAFPELGSQPTAEEMEGKTMMPEDVMHTGAPSDMLPRLLTEVEAAATEDALATIWKDGVKEINATKDKTVYDQFKAAVGKRGKELKNAAVTDVEVKPEKTLLERIKSANQDELEALGPEIDGAPGAQQAELNDAFNARVTELNEKEVAE